VGYAFFYDLTKILQDLPNQALYMLFHEETRAIVRDDRITYRPVRWRDFKLNFMNRRFTVQYGKKKITVWDVFAFFQGKFSKALEDWKIGEAATLANIVKMKDLRSTFDEMGDAEIEAYCNDECRLLAKLFRSLLNAHTDVGIPLATFYGAGSTAKAILKKMDAKKFMSPPPEEMRDAISRSFFGGRFENSIIGSVDGPVYNYDISSAYPYQTYFLPCLTHGTWHHAQAPTSRDIAKARLSLVRWTIPPSFVTKLAAFGPFPVRSSVGTIAFPLGGMGGWVWGEEFIAGQKLQPATRAKEAWLYECSCDCHPFREVPNYYRERVRLGKDSKGIVLKLGPNAIYGSLAQSRGLSPPFQNWIWASVITSNTRAMLLDAIHLTGEFSWNILMLATDGIFSRYPLTLPKPKDTGTYDLPKPLGGWESETFESGIFAARPGVYFPLNPSESQLKKVRGRGIGKKALYDRCNIVVRAFEARAKSCKLIGLQRFIGAKSAIHKSGRGYSRSRDYGEWVNHTVEVTFDPAPKRERVGNDGRLLPWRYFDWESEPYEPATKSPEGIALMMAKLIAEEQPDIDFADLDFEETA